MREDPLLRRDRGLQLFVWSATLSKGLYNLNLSGKTLTRDTIRGRETEGEAFEVLSRMVREGGWEVAVEVRSGEGQYYVLQQPSKANDWIASLRVDDEWTKFDNATELVVWAVPAQ